MTRQPFFSRLGALAPQQQILCEAESAIDGPARRMVTGIGFLAAPAAVSWRWPTVGRRADRTRLLLSLRVTAVAASPLLRAGLNYASNHDFKNALYALGRSQKEELDTFIEASLWKLVICTAQSRSRNVLWVTLSNGTKQASLEATKASFRKMAESIFLEAVVASKALLENMELLSTRAVPRYLTLKLPVNYLAPVFSGAFEAMCEAGLYPGDSAAKDRTEAMEWLLFGGTLMASGGAISRSDAGAAFTRGVDTFRIDMARLLVAQIAYFNAFGGLDTPLGDRLDRATAKVLELTKDDPYCEPRLEAERLLAERQALPPK